MGTMGRAVASAAVGLLIIGVVSANAPTGHGGATEAGSGAARSTGVAARAGRFKAFVNRHGTAPQKSAVSHVTAVEWIDERDGVPTAVDVHTDFTGGLTGKGPGPSRLIATAFAHWIHAHDSPVTDDGLVTVYDTDGDLIGGGNF